MQGRLSEPLNNRIQCFPKMSWKEEFSKAKTVGLESIEWIFEADDWHKNPIATESGIGEINQLIENTRVIVQSVCADYFMDIPYLKADRGTRRVLEEKLKWLVGHASRIGAKYIDLPFVDASAIPSEDQFKHVKEFVQPALAVCEELGLTIALETSLSPAHFRRLLESIAHPCLMANYDSGNSASLGYDCAEELDAYGSWLRTVHIKDRVKGGGTVPLGTGNANFPVLFSRLREVRYEGPIILQAAREENEVATCQKNLNFVTSFIRN